MRYGTQPGGNELHRDRDADAALHRWVVATPRQDDGVRLRRRPARDGEVLPVEELRQLDVFHALRARDQRPFAGTHFELHAAALRAGDADQQADRAFLARSRLCGAVST